MNYSIVYTESYRERAEIHDTLYSYNLSKTGAERQDVQAKDEPGAGAWIVKDENGKSYGGVVFHFLSDPRRIYVDYFYLADEIRGQGWGMKVFAALEEFARKEGAASITLTTNTYQAPGFYKKAGFVQVGAKAAPQPKVPDNIHYTFRKEL